MDKHILAIDQGTTSSRAIVFDMRGNIISVAQQEFTQHFPENGWVEHTPSEIWQSTLTVCKQALNRAQLCAENIDAIGITNQRETTIVWDKATGDAIYPAIVWQDRRTADFCTSLKQDNFEVLVKEKTGLLLDPYFSATKIHWILDNVEGAQTKANNGELAFGTVDSFLLWHLTGGKVHATDATNASRTMLFNIHTQSWDEELLALFKIPASMLPEVKDCAGDFGQTEQKLLGHSIPITGIAGDQQAALIGQACFDKGMIKSTYGTGCFALINTGSEALSSENKLLTTVAYRINGQTTYALEGSIFIAGAVVQWLRDKLNIIEHAKDTEAAMKSVASTDGVYFIPAFTGLGCPYWEPNVRAAILGMTRGTTDAQIIRAALEAVAFQTRDLIEAMANDGATWPTTMRVDGGMVNNHTFVQFLSDILESQIDIPRVTETTALGAAYLAALGAGLYDSLEEISENWHIDKSFSANHTDEHKTLYAGWQKNVSGLIGLS